MTEKPEKPVTKDELTLEQLTTLVGEASGWGDRVNITFRINRERDSVPPRTFIAAAVGICGSKDTSVSASGSDHRAALVSLLQNIESHHREVLRWHKQRCATAREILDAYGIYYVKGDL